MRYFLMEPLVQETFDAIISTSNKLMEEYVAQH
jgi:hypothetical protein